MTKNTTRPVLIDPGYRIPTPIDPGEIVCIKCYVPKDTFYLGAFWSQLWALARWNTWQRDSDRRGKDVAALWRELIQQARDEYEQSGGVCCDMDVRQKPDVPCVLQKYVAGEWVDFADMRLCVPKLRLSGGKIQQDTTGSGDWQDASETGDFDQKSGGEYKPQWETVPENESAECLSSRNVALMLNYTIATFCGTWAGAEGFAGALAFLVGFAAAWLTDGIAAPLFALIDTLALWEFNQFANAGAMVLTDDLTELMACLYDETGYMSPDHHAELMDRFDDTISGLSVDYEIVRWRFTKFYAQWLGPVGMTLAGKAWGIQSYDCERACYDWTVELDFTTGAHGFEATDDDRWPGVDCGDYVSGTGWDAIYQPSNGYRILKIYRESETEFTLKHAETFWSMDVSGGGVRNAATSAIQDEYYNLLTNRTDYGTEEFSLVWDGEVGDTTKIEIQCEGWPLVLPFSGCTKIILSGSGTPPDWS